MFQAKEHIPTVSMKLSEVLADIGVNERMVQKKRRAWLLTESVNTISLQLRDIHGSMYNLGSQSEGTTTPGLHSDTDNLLCTKDFNVIQDWIDWKPGVRNLLMIQDETVPPGYCLLQQLRHDAPLPNTGLHNEFYFQDRSGRVLLRNKAIQAAVSDGVIDAGVRHGPAYAVQGQPGVADYDYVGALSCESWPLQATQWLERQGGSQWPSDDMKRYCSTTGCFLVAVGQKGSENEEIEWRISTSLAERCLMFNLNITQIRCYVLMKMILKTFIQPQYEDAISSFMCKTILLHLIPYTKSNFWKETNLLVCLSMCLFELYRSILNENCPHVIIPGNNLMARRISHESKPHILEILLHIINSEGTALLGIEFDGLGSRLQLKMNDIHICIPKKCRIVSGILLRETAQNIDLELKHYLTAIRNKSCVVTLQTLLKYISKLAVTSNKGHKLDHAACSLLVPWFCTTLGVVLASLNIQRSSRVSGEALAWISLGLNTDVSASKLKLASVLYCMGDSEITANVLREIEGKYDRKLVEPMCRCNDDYINQNPRIGFDEASDSHNEEALQTVIAFCVRFLPCETNCIPEELHHEMLRSTEEDLVYRGEDEKWMDMAVVDSLPYLYFLQYKTYSYLGKHDDAKSALLNKIRTIEQEPNLGHRETALNLLGQCFEQENRQMDALRCYKLSLNLRGRHNAAKFHACRLLSSMIKPAA